MLTWIAVVLAGVGSYAMRLAPLVWGERRAIGERTQQVLRHAGMGGIAALVVYSVVGATRGGEIADLLPTLGAIAVAAILTFHGRSMTLALIIGGAVQVVGALVVSL